MEVAAASGLSQCCVFQAMQCFRMALGVVLSSWECVQT